MVRGFYNWTSGMLSQGRRLDVIANNMSKAASPGVGHPVLHLDGEKALALNGKIHQELERNPYGLFTGQGAQINEDAVIHHKWVERSNVNLVKPAPGPALTGTGSPPYPA